VIINWFSKTQRINKTEEIPKKEYANICGIVDIVEFKTTPKEITGVLLDSEGREFEFKVRPDGDLIYLNGLKEDLPFVWQICVDYLKKYYGKNEFDSIKNYIKTTNLKIQQLYSIIEELKEEVAEIEVPEIISQVQAPPVIEKPVITSEQQFDKMFDGIIKPQESSKDFSDEDLANHALKVLSGEFKFNAEV